MDNGKEFNEQLDDCIEEARKEGLSLEQIVHSLNLKIKDIQIAIKLGGAFLVTHMD